ncbi:FtsX-like permease family protein [Natrialbaceae archaeon A-CW1-1]
MNTRWQPPIGWYTSGTGRWSPMGEGSRLARWLGVCGLVASHLASHTRRAPGRTLATVALVAITIAVLLTVTGIAVSLADDSPASTGTAMYVTPEDGGTLSPVVDVKGPRLEGVHDRSEAIDAHPEVEYATPVLTEVVQVRTREATEPEVVLALGVVPRETPISIYGFSTAPLEPGDPYYADGDYDGPETGDVILSAATADRLDVAEGEQLLFRSMRTGGVSQSHVVTAIDNADGTAGLELPVIVLRLSELQSLTGTAEADRADHLLVEADPTSPAVREVIETQYPDATIQTAGEVDEGALYDDDLALATSAIAALVGVVLCTLFIATAAAITVERDRQRLAILEALGFAGSLRLAVVALTTLALALAGALLGLALGAAGVALLNRIATETIAPDAVAVFLPVFVPYALGVALLAGLIALPYPVALARRTTALEELRR